eukprot:GDKJ01054035.1.p1 GENE.GDKJ01054035.1~~GDKJ01054035.1.p1  ORF type:complete len:1264 (-),score=313.95 GDKJ01054035.1:45-3437(-)
MNFCHKVLWPLFHNVVQIDSIRSQTFDQTQWYHYQHVNKAFADTVSQQAQDRLDVVWVHDYPLLLVPQFLMRKLRFVNVGVFLHSCFPSSELFRMLPVREEILRGVLCADLVGFQFFEYARHFLVAAKRIIGIDHRIRLGGLLQVEYSGRPVMIKVGHPFLDPSAIVSNWPSVEAGVVEAAMSLRRVAGEGRFIFGAIDRCDILAGLDRKFDAYASFLRTSPYAKGRVTLVQYVYFPTVAAASAEEHFLKLQQRADAINEEFKDFGAAIVFRPGPIGLEDKWGLYLTADCYIDTSLKQGLSLTPFEFLLIRNLLSSHAFPSNENTANASNPVAGFSFGGARATTQTFSTFFSPPNQTTMSNSGTLQQQQNSASSSAINAGYLKTSSSANLNSIMMALLKNNQNFNPCSSQKDLMALPNNIFPSIPTPSNIDPNLPGAIINSLRMYDYNKKIDDGILNPEIVPLLSGSQPYATVIISEFAGVSRVLASAKRVNPYDPRVLVLALDEACRTRWPSPLDPPLTDASLKTRLQEQSASSSSVCSSLSLLPEEVVLFNSDLSFVLNNSTHHWAEGFLMDLRRARKRRDINFVQVGLGAGLRLLGLDQAFASLDFTTVVNRYKLANRRVFFLDYEGTLTASTSAVSSNGVSDEVDSEEKIQEMINQMIPLSCLHQKPHRYTPPQHNNNQPSSENEKNRSPSRTPPIPTPSNTNATNSANGGGLEGLYSRGAPPSNHCRETLTKLCSDPRNHVVVLSGRRKEDLEAWLGDIPGLGLCAEHGFLYKLPRESTWKNAPVSGVVGGVTAGDIGPWKSLCYDLMSQFVERTPGAFIENKGSALVFQYRAADEEFGLWQSKELHNFLSEFLYDHPVDVISGKGYLEVRLRGVTKGKAIERILQQLSSKRYGQNDQVVDEDGSHSTSQQQQHPDFILCMGDDRSDEDMFLSLHTLEEQIGGELATLAASSNAAENNEESSHHHHHHHHHHQKRIASSNNVHMKVVSSIANIYGTTTAAGLTSSASTNFQQNMTNSTFSNQPHPFTQTTTNNGADNNQNTPAVMNFNFSQQQTDLQALSQSIFSVTVGKKPSAAKFFLHDVTEVNDILDILSAHSFNAPLTETIVDNASIGIKSQPSSPPKLYA